VDAGVTFVRRRWRTLLALRVAGEHARVERIARRSGGSVTLSASSIAGAALAISPQRGWRASLRLRHRWNANGTAASDAVLNGSAYARGTRVGFAHQAAAVRFSAGTIRGSDPVVFGVGGVSSGVFEPLPGLLVGGGSRTFPVRGYPASWLVGRSAATVSLELRQPLVMVGSGPGLFPPVTLDRLSTVLFADGGMAWHSSYCPSTGPSAPGTAPGCARLIGSAGAELVADAGVPYDFPVRLRFGAAWRFDLKSAAAYAAVGSAF
jgi:outer membrane protein assembly factor BamA